MYEVVGAGKKGKPPTWIWQGRALESAVDPDMIGASTHALTLINTKTVLDGHFSDIEFQAQQHLMGEKEK